MRIAVIGTGISGMVAARLLADAHEISVFEANDYIGGHTHTVPVQAEGQMLAVDTGFIVYNETTYPNFTRLLALLKVPTQTSDMSFSVSCERTGLEYNGGSLNALFAQRRNLFRPWFFRMIGEILRFNREAPGLLVGGDDATTLGQYVESHGYSRAFVEYYLIPMGAALWSARPAGMLDFPIRFFVRFFANHGLLTVSERLEWRVVTGGSEQYVAPLVAPFHDRIRLRTPVRCVRRFEDCVEITPAEGAPERFDQVVIAAHADQALALLVDPTDREREILGSFAYQENDVVLHTDRSVLPSRPRAWASWNYRIPREDRDRVVVTYLMNRLQGLDARQCFCVTLNRTDTIGRESVIRRLAYHHPVYSAAAVHAQSRHAEISGMHRTHYCGAYWGYGFHEDGVCSALAVGRWFGRERVA